MREAEPTALKRGLAALLIVVAGLAWADGAGAHSVGLSRGDYRVQGATVAVLLVFSGVEFATAQAPASGGASTREAIMGDVVIDADGVACRSGPVTSEPAEGDAVAIRATFVCDRPPHELAIDCRFIDRFSTGHRHLAAVSAGGVESSFVLVHARTRIEMDLSSASAPTTSFGAMVWAGVSHILTGYDHLAFLFGLLLMGGTLRSLAGVISAFTLAHSMTLALAVLRVVTISPNVVEPAIALSIAYVGIENLFGVDPAKRWRITFPFGLIHGFGFASALIDLDLPRAAVPAALIAFNLGVEIGQLAVVVVVLPIIVWARRSGAFRKKAVPALSLGLALLGAGWFVLRIR